MKLMKFLLCVLLLTLALPAGSAKVEDLSRKKQEIANMLYQVESSGGDQLGYSKEILEYLEKTEKITPKIKGGKELMKTHSRRNRGNDIDYYSLLSGGLAIRESLQIESIKPGIDKGGTVSISGLKGPEIKSHPFKEMLKGRKSKTFSLARYAPENFYYLHFNNMPGALDFFDYLSDAGGSLHKRVSPQSADFMIKERILTQLALRENKSSRVFYRHIIEEMAITGSDPFIMEGSDISILYKIRSKAVFTTKINEYRRYFKKKYNARDDSVTIGGIKGRILQTGDRRIYSIYLVLPDDTAVISNSVKAVEHIIETFENPKKSLAEADDFKYMRSIYPAEARSEDGFLYLSDSFIRRLVGPELRIKEARRMYEAGRISVMERYILYYYQLNGKHPASIEEFYSILKNPENPGGGSDSGRDFFKALFDGLRLVQGTFSAASVTYGRNGFMIPNLEIPIDTVSEIEASEYNRFLAEYNSFWRNFFDPIGIRFKTGKGIRVETCILPLIDNSLYNRLMEFAGGKPVRLNPDETVPGDIFSLTLKLNQKFLKGSGVDEILKQMAVTEPELQNHPLSDIIRGDIRFHMNDSRPLADFNAGGITGELFRGNFRKGEAFFGFLAWSLFHPVRISIPVKDGKAAAVFLNSLNRYFMAQAKDRWTEIKSYSYEYERDTPEIKVIKITFAETLTFRLYIAIKDDNIHISTTEHYMRAVLGHRFQEKQASPNDKSNITAVYRPSQMLLEKNMFMANVMEDVQAASFRNMGTIKLMKALFPASKDPQESAMENFGFKPLCPMGGSYTINEKGEVANSVFGTMDRPVIRYDRIHSDMMKKHFSTERIMLDLEFTDEGIMTTVEIE